MELFIATILVSAAIAVYLTALICRRSLARGRRPAFWQAVVAAFCGPIAIVSASEGRDLFTYRFWYSTEGREALPWMGLFICLCAIANIFPSIGVIFLYRRKMRH